jgi:hypothetical protein
VAPAAESEPSRSSLEITATHRRGPPHEHQRILCGDPLHRLGRRVPDEQRDERRAVPELHRPPARHREGRSRGSARLDCDSTTATLPPRPGRRSARPRRATPAAGSCR